VLLEYIERFRPAAFIETGTYRGDTVAAVHSRVPQVISIELDPTLVRFARRRFADIGNVTIIEGDSAHELRGVLATVTEPSMLWLDGHFSGGVTANSGDSPVVSELHAVIAAGLPHVVLVDDIRLFDGTAGYPTLRALLDCLDSSQVEITNQDDILRIVPVGLGG
jgi:hypothetical protein